MVGLISETAGDANIQWEDMGNNVPSSAIDAAPWLRDSNLMASSIGNAQATYGAFDEFGRQTSEPEPAITKDEANQRYAIPGRLTFANDLPESVAQDMNAAKHSELVRQDAVARRPGGFAAGATDFGLGTAAMLLDPVDLASLFIPVLPEGRIAGALAEAGLDGLAGRTAARVIAGGGSGAVQQAALGVPRYLLSQQEHADYGASDLLWDTLYGAALGGVAHGAIGLARETFGGVDDVTRAFQKTRLGQVMAEEPSARQAVMNSTLASVLDDRPVDVEPLGELWSAKIARENETTNLRLQQQGLQRELNSLLDEAASVPEGAPADPVTRARLGDIDAQMARPGLTAAQAEELQATRRMLVEGQSTASSELERARSDAQRQGLMSAAMRTDEEIRKIQDRIAQSETVRQAGGGMPRDMQAVSEAANRAVMEPRPEPGAIPPGIEAHTAEVTEALTRADAAGLLTDADHSEIKAANSWLDQAKQFGQGALQAAACIARGLV